MSNSFGKWLFLQQKMKRKYFESGNKTFTFQIHFLNSFNMSFESSWIFGTYSSKNRSKLDPRGLWKK